jgi:ferritin-like metal-binding protein YciE
MSLVALRSLYLAELHDLYEAERQVLLELPLLAAAAHSAELREAFDSHYRETLHHIDRLNEVFRHLDERPRTPSCRGLRAVIEEARLRKAHLPSGPALDAALMAFGQRLEHFQIAAYQGARTYAVALADADGASLLQQTLDEEEAMDQRLTALALKSARLPAAASFGNPALVFSTVGKAS